VQTTLTVPRPLNDENELPERYENNNRPKTGIMIVACLIRREGT
jgi:hypothetical protein